MKKIMSIVLAVFMLMTVVPTSLTFAAQTEPSTFWLDSDEENGYIGNYALISNPSINQNNSAATGDLTDAIRTGDELNADSVDVQNLEKTACEDGFLMSTEDKIEGTKAPNQQWKVGDSFEWVALDDAYEMYQAYVTVTNYPSTCVAVGEYCYVWASSRDGAAYRIGGENAQLLADEFDRQYAEVVNNYGTFDSAAGNTKINIICHNLSEGMPAYFYDFEFRSLGNNEGQYFFHVDTLGTMIDSTDYVWNVEKAYEPMLKSFVDMVIFLRTRENVPLWLAQVLRQASVPLVYGDEKTEECVENWSNATADYRNGKSIYKWAKTDFNTDPTYLYMFGQYLKQQYGTYEVFADILDAYVSTRDTVGEVVLPSALAGTSLDSLTLPEILEAYRIALVVKDEDTIYGFRGAEEFDAIPVECYNGTGLNELYGGGAILVRTLETGIFNPCDDASDTLKYVGITTDIDDLPTVNCVIFMDYDGTFLKEQLVFDGDDAVPPAQPYHQGMTFIGWDKEYTNIQESMTITAVYEDGETYHTVTMINTVSGEEMGKFDVIRGFAPTMPQNPRISGFSFTGWYTEDGKPFDTEEPIYGDVTIYAHFINAVTIYGYTFPDYTFSSFSTECTEEFTSHSSIDNNLRFLYAAAYLDGTIYGFNDLNNFVTVDAETYVSEIAAEDPNNGTIYRCLDMTYDYTTDTMYISYIDANGKGNLGKVDLETGIITKVAETATFYMAIACNKQGDLFCVLPNCDLATVNKTNGRYGKIGSTGVSLSDGETVNFTCMTFDYNTGYLYWAAMDGYTSETYLYLVDTTDASLINLGRVAEDYQLHAMYIPYTYDVETYYTVRFVDYDGKILSEQQVKEGEAAVAPADPVREGYVFKGWDKDFSNVQSDLRITAQYEPLPVYTVTFVDYDFSVLATQQVYQGNSAVAPADPVREGYTFTGWSCDFTNVQSDLVVVAQYVEGNVTMYTVTYKDGLTDEIITTAKVQENTVIDPQTMPTAPVHEGYTFVGWDYDGTPVTGDITVTANYVVEQDGPGLGDSNGDGKVNTADAVTILRFAAEMAELTEEQMRAADVNCDGVVNTGDAVLILKYAAGIIDTLYPSGG